MRACLRFSTPLLSASLVLGLAACGPSGPASEGGTTTQSSSTETSTTSMTSATTETDTSTTTESESADVVPILDDGFGGIQDCDPFLQDCPDGEKCMPYASQGGNWDAHKCVPILDDQGVGDTCVYDGPIAATDDCDGTSMCWNTVEVDGEFVGTCTPLCTGNPAEPECPDNYYCALSGEGVLTLCLQTCDPLLQECGDGEGCYWVNQQFVCVGPTQDTPLGEPCAFLQDCVAGLFCVAEANLPACADASCCASFCDLGVGDAFCEDLVPGTVCVPFFEEGGAPAEHEDVGVCILPLP